MFIKPREQWRIASVAAVVEWSMVMTLCTRSSSRLATFKPSRGRCDRRASEVLPKPTHQQRCRPHVLVREKLQPRACQNDNLQY